MRFFVLAFFAFLSCESNLLASWKKPAVSLLRQAFRGPPTVTKTLAAGFSTRSFSGAPRGFRFGNQTLEALKVSQRRVVCGDDFVVQNSWETQFRQALNEQLLTYAKNVDWEGIEACLQGGADPRFVEALSGDNIYHILARSSYRGAAYPIIFSLLQRGIGDPKATNHKGKTPYRVAFEEDNIGGVALFPSDTALR